MSNKRYFWLKLNENFFEGDTMMWLEEQKNREQYMIFYLKLCLKSLGDEGRLVRYVGEKIIPYDVPALAKLTKTPVDTVAVAMKMFIEFGLVTKYDSGELYMNQINEMIGSETDAAKRKRQQRLRQKQQLSIENECDIVPELSHECPTEIEKEKDIEIDKEEEQEAVQEKIQEKMVVVDERQKNLKRVNNFYQGNFGVMTSHVMQDLDYWIEDLGIDLVLRALELASEHQKNYAYAKGIMKKWALKI